MSSPKVYCEVHHVMYSFEVGCPLCQGTDFLMEVCEKAVSLYGPKLQLMQLVEELAELMVAVIQFDKGKGSLEDVLGELVDVDLMVTQAKVIFRKHTSTLKTMRAQKLFRQMQRIQGHVSVAKKRVSTLAPREMRP